MYDNFFEVKKNYLNGTMIAYFACCIFVFTVNSENVWV